MVVSDPRPVWLSSATVPALILQVNASEKPKAESRVLHVVDYPHADFSMELPVRITDLAGYVGQISVGEGPVAVAQLMQLLQGLVTSGFCRVET